MENISDKQFTWGFEIEGLISEKLQEKLQSIESKGGYDFVYKADGSVGVDKPAGVMLGEFNTEEDDDMGNERYKLITETNAGVFNSLGEMLEVLKVFENGKNYFQNHSCGVHIHIKPKARWSWLKYCLFNSQFIGKIQGYAESGLCEHIQDRIQHGHWCRAFYRTETLLNNYQRHEKYVFMGNHPQGTTEFRFFSSCKDKEKNITAFFNVFFNEFSKVGELPKKYFFLDDKNYQRYDDCFNIKQNKVLRLAIN